jgi:site-specific recombinase XerD
MKRTDFAFYLSKFFVEHMPGAKGSSPQTIDSYRYGFMRFLDFLHEVKSLPADRVAISDLTYDNVRDFLGWLQDVHHNSVSTRNQRQAALKSFVKYLMYEYPDYLNEYQRILAIPVKKCLKPEIAFLKSNGVKLLIGQPDTETRTGLRDYAILATLFTTGIRVSELIGLRVKDISLQDPYTMLVHGKGNKYRYVQITKYLAPIINRYLLENGYDCPEKMSEWLFLNHMGHKFTRQGINYLVKKYAMMAHNVSPELISDDFSPHKMRHSAAMSLLDAGVDLIYIRDLLGHVSVKTTEIYIRTDARLKREAIEAASMEIVPKEAAKWENDDGLKDWLKNFGKRR